MSRGNLQADIDRFGRMYVASSHVSRAVMRSRSREELLAEVARVLVEVGGFAMVSVRWHDPETQELVPVAEFGNGLDYVRSIRVFADERPEGLGPAGIAFRENRPYICNDCLTDASTLPWRRFIRTHGWHSYAAFPICIAGTPRGLLSIYTLDAGVFGPEQVELLGSVTSDIEFGLEHLAEEERRSHAEAALAESERRLNLALDAAGMGTFELDVATGKVIWDGRLVQILGFVPGGFEGTVAAFVRRVHPEDRARVLADLDHARDSHTSFAHEFRGLWPDGIERWTHSRGEYRYGNSGQPERLYGVATDITARKQAEAELRRNEERLQQAVRVSGIGIFDYDHATDTLFYSPRQREMIHFGPDEPVSMQIYFSLVHPDDLPRVHAAALRGHDPAGDGRFDVEHRALLRDGTIGWVSVRAQTFFEGEGAARHAVRTVGATREITAEVKAAEEQRRLASLVAMSRSFIATATLEGRVEYMNQAAMDVVGIESLEEARKKSIFEFCADSDHAFARDVVHPAVIKHGSWTGEARFRNFKTDTVVDVEMVIFVVRDESGVPLYLETVSQDITGRKRVEAEREKLREQLFQAQKMKSIGRLAGGVAHDFNNMLTVINGYTRILLDRLKPGDEMRLDLEEVSKAGVRAAALTEQLLAFSRMQVRQPRTLNLNRVVVQVQPMLERLLGEDVELNLLLHPEAAMVCADEHQLEQVVMNLVVNSRDAMPAGGTINIETAIVENVRLQTGTAARAGNSVVLKVHDTGVGMDEETRKHISEPFFTSKQVGQGTGLGLSVIQGIVEQNAGCIEFTSAPGQGTTFWIYLPRAPGAEALEPAPEIVPPLSGTETVLIVEDTPEVRRYAAAVLAAYGYRVLQAQHAAEALELCAAQGKDIDMVVTDVVMPNMSGRELADRIKQRWPKMKQLFMSGYTGDAMLRHGIVQGETELLQKPFTPEQLALQVRRILDVPANRPRIVIADDEAGVRRFLRLVLESGGYDVIEAADGAQAIAAVQSGGVDLLITDLVMPGQEGIETINGLRNEVPGLGIIAISGAFGGQYLEVARLLGAHAALGKPLKPDVLLATVAQVLRDRR